MATLAIFEIPKTRRPARSFSLPLAVGVLSLHALVLFLFSHPVSSFVPTVPQTQQQLSRISLSMVSSIDESTTKTETQNQQQEQDLHVVVVGGGVGGMAVAARIASQQQQSSKKTRVTLLEKNSQIGGRCGSFWVDPSGGANEKNKNLYRFEQGPSLLLLKSVYEDVFRETTGKEAIDYGLDIVQCSPAYQIVFDDGDCISVGFPKCVGDEAALSEEEIQSRAQMDAYEPNGAQKWDDYMATTAAYLDAGLPNFIEEKIDLLSLPNFLYRSLKDSAKAWPLKSHSEVLDELFESTKLKALASFQDLYVGLEPYKNEGKLAGGVLSSTAPAVFGLLAAIELHPNNKNAGVFAPIGGFQSVTNAFEKLLDELGVEIQCDTTVSKVTNDGVWVRPNDANEASFLASDLTIVNADLPYAKNSLLSKDKSEQVQDGETAKSFPPSTDKFDWDDKFSFSSGVISFYWSLNKPLDALNTHNVFLSTKSRSEAEASWKVLREKPTLFDNSEKEEDSPFNFYVHRASETDPTAAPQGGDTIMVLVPCRTLLRDEECAKLPRDEAMKKYQEQFTPEEISRVKRAVLKRFAAVESLKNLEAHILHEEYRTPATWAERYNLAAGTPFALVSTNLFYHNARCSSKLDSHCNFILKNSRVTVLPNSALPAQVQNLLGFRMLCIAAPAHVQEMESLWC